MSLGKLKEEWTDLLARRPAFHSTLAVCGDIFELWARWSPARLSPLAWTAEECRERWERERWEHHRDHRDHDWH